MLERAVQQRRREHPNKTSSGLRDDGKARGVKPPFLCEKHRTEQDGQHHHPGQSRVEMGFEPAQIRRVLGLKQLFGIHDSDVGAVR